MELQYVKKPECEYIKVSHDKFRFPVESASSIDELASICGVSRNSIYKQIKKFIQQERSGIEPTTLYEVVRLDV